jgi:hypothetical protein
MKINWDKDWFENEYWHLTKFDTGDRAFEKYAFEVDDALVDEYFAALEAVETARKVVRKIEVSITAIKKAHEEEVARIAYESGAKQRAEEQAKRVAELEAKKAAKRERYFAKFPERRVSGWSEQKRLAKLEKISDGVTNE